MEAKEYYRFLLQRYYDGTATEAETEELFAELRKEADEDTWTELISELHSQAPADPAYNAAAYEQDLARILQPQQQPPLRIWWRYAAAAAATAALLIGGIWYFTRPVRQAETTPAGGFADVKPGTSGAVLTLADGSQIVLDSLQNGVVTQQQGTTVLLQNGQLAYQASGNSAAGNNTMTTPRGRRFRLQLPDGTLVWLNAASAISFPTAFSRTERKVRLTGEAYFEVTPDKAAPFIVTLNNQTAVQVLGTHFNISAYPDEPQIRTTLMEGAVKVKLQQQEQVLKPGQQLQINNAGGPMQLQQHVDTSAVIGWKNGILHFDNKKLTEVINMIARWYDIEVVYKTVPADISFVGETGSDVNLSSVLNFLKESGIHFRMEGKTLVVGE
ncbi:FecR family protein [Chitinophaga solisilvae]|uniref:FecR family protein n=1 Tax=Chitinophaga solisilvae TaxID=1233460 RepID=UPI00136E6845|nr:FecR family protein [Chitinophaga solisilvae]